LKYIGEVIRSKDYFDGLLNMGGGIPCCRMNYAERDPGMDRFLRVGVLKRLVPALKSQRLLLDESLAVDLVRRHSKTVAPFSSFTAYWIAGERVEEHS